MKIRVGVDAERSRLGRLTMSDSSGTSGPVDVCATADSAAAHAPLGGYALKEARAVEVALVPELGDTALVFEPLSGDARLAESLGRFVLELHAGRPGDDGRLRTTSRGLRVWPETLARVASALARGERIELTIHEAPLTLWDLIFFWRRRPSRGFGTSDTTRDVDDGWQSSSSSSGSGSSSRDDAFSGSGGQFGGGGASGSWDSARTGAAVAAGAALGAGIVAASESGSTADADATDASGGDVSY